jgi:hypothetical protein
MNRSVVIFGIIGICALLIWATAATIIALKERNNYQTTNALLQVVYAGLDNCFSYCGSPGSWVDAQKTKLADFITSILQTQTKITCGNPSTDFPALSQCAVSSLSQTYSYWTVVDPSNRAAGNALIQSAINQCISSGQVPGCKIQM